MGLPALASSALDIAQGCRTECTPSWRAALPGALVRRRGRVDRPRRGNRHDADFFSPAHGCAVEKPGTGSRTCRAGLPGQRQAGWPSLLVTFLLATQEKSHSRAKGARKPLIQATSSNQSLDRGAPRMQSLFGAATKKHRAQGALLLVVSKSCGVVMRTPGTAQLLPGSHRQAQT